MTLTLTSSEGALDVIDRARTSGDPLWIEGSGSSPGPDGPERVSTAAMDRILEYRPEDLTVAVEAGVTIGALDQLLAAQRQTAVLPEDSPHRTIGGVVASGASGYRRLRYGPTRDRVIGVTLATGYGQVVKGGGQLVKNVTGYDLPRLVTGSYGSLGIITEIILKLWPVPPRAATFAVPEAAAALRTAYQPLAVLESHDGSFVYAEGSQATIEVLSRQLSSEPDDEHVWPSPWTGEVLVSLRVPPRRIAEGVAIAREVHASWWVAQHGVGRIDVGFDRLDRNDLDAMRRKVATLGGVLVIERHPEMAGLDRWGHTPGGHVIQARMVDLFDPDHVCNPGVLPGGDA